MAATNIYATDTGVRTDLLVPGVLHQLLCLLRQEVLLLLQAVSQSAQQTEAIVARQQTAQIESEAKEEEDQESGEH